MTITNTIIPNVIAANALMLNANDFLNAGLKTLFSPNIDIAEAKMAVVSIQTAIELFAKFRLVKDHGVESIIVGSVPTGPLEQFIQNGNFRTIGYNQCIKRIKSEEWFTEMDDEVVKNLQYLRNNLVHFSANISIENVRICTAHMLVRALAMFAAGEDRNNGEMYNHKSFLNEDNFTKLTQFPPYRAESVDTAIDDRETEKIFRCWECEADSLALRLSEAYFCHCCGVSALSNSVAYTDCPLCAAIDGVCYDPLNPSGDKYRGKCLYCSEIVLVN